MTASSTEATAAHYNLRYVLFVAAVAALGGLLFGYDWVVIGGAKPFYERFFGLNSARLIGWANSCALVGCLLGSIAAGTLGDRFGRRILLILSAALFGISSIATGLANSFGVFVLWRITGGIAIGIASNVSPTYIAEISPATWRGRLVALNQLMLVIGILMAQIVNWLIAERVPAHATDLYIRQSWNGQYGWRWMFAAVAVPSAIFLLCSWFVPESPRWLAQAGKSDAARRVLQRIGGTRYGDSALQAIFADLEHGRQSAGWHDILRAPLRGVLVAGVALAVLQQWSGINIIFNYAEEIYKRAGYSVNDILFNIVITGSVNLAFTLISMAVVDRAGRRPLMIFGCASIAAAHGAIGVAYRLGLTGLPILILTLCTIGFYAMSLAPVTWVLIAEIFPTKMRGRGVSLSVSALWTASFLLTYSFPLINEALGAAGTFWLYGFICCLGLWFVVARVPETRGKTLEQISAGLNTA